MTGLMLGSDTHSYTAQKQKFNSTFTPQELQKDTQGFALVGMAISLLLCLSLILSVAAIQWIGSRNAHIQQVADATALAGANVVGSYATVAKISDACVLSMGLTGVLVFGAGLILSCIPGFIGMGINFIDSANKIFDARKHFAKTAVRGLQTLESILPGLITLNGFSCARENSHDKLTYTGLAIPYPLTSQSDFSSLLDEVDLETLHKQVEKLQEQTKEIEELQAEQTSAKQRAWEADCGSQGYCMRERADKLAGLSAAQNPTYPLDRWNFGVALSRSRVYYRARAAAEELLGKQGDELVRSACRKAFYEYASQQMNRSSYQELPDSTIQIDFSELPKNTDEMKQTTLYTDSLWPCSQEGDARYIHPAKNCTGMHGALTGFASLQDLDAGVVKSCPELDFSISSLGKVASASSSIDNGYEYYWRIIVEEGKKFTAASNKKAALEAEQKTVGETSQSLLAGLLDKIKAPKPILCPPGAWGCIAAVLEDKAQQIPSELTRAFIPELATGKGIAIAGAVLAPDDSTAENTVLAHFFDRLSAEDSLLGGLADGVTTLWGSILVGYGSLFETVATQAGGFLDNLDGLFSSHIGRWLKDKISGFMTETGFDSVDLRLKKPLLTNTANIFKAAGVSQSEKIRSFVQKLPDHASITDIAAGLGVELKNKLLEKEFVLAELAIPGTDISIPFKIKLRDALGGVLDGTR